MDNTSTAYLLQPSPHQSPRAWYILTILVLVQGCISLAIRATGSLGPFLQAEWSLTVAQVGLLQSAIYAGQVIGGIPAGGLSDRLGVKHTLLLAPLIIGASYGAVAVSTGYLMALIALFFAGLGQVTVHGGTNKGIVQWFPPARRGLAVGIKQASVSGGSMAAALILPPLALAWGWQAAVSALVVAIAALAVAAYFTYQNPPAPTTSRRIANAGAITKLLTNPAMLALGGYAFLMGGVQMSASSYILLYLNGALGYSIVRAAVFLAMLDFWGMGARVVWGSISDRWFIGRRERLLQLLAIISAAGSVGLAATEPATSSLWVATAIALIGVSAVGFHGIWMNLASEIGGEEAAATATGISLAMGASGIALVTPVVGSVIDWTGSYSYGWLACAAISAVALLLVWRFRIDPHRDA